MSSTYDRMQAMDERQLAKAVVAAMGVDFEFVSVALLGRRVLLHGTAPSYAAKARAEMYVREAGFPEVDNRLRVIPGLDPYSTPRPL